MLRIMLFGRNLWMRLPLRQENEPLIELHLTVIPQSQAKTVQIDKLRIWYTIG